MSGKELALNQSYGDIVRDWVGKIRKTLSEIKDTGHIIDDVIMMGMIMGADEEIKIALNKEYPESDISYTEWEISDKRNICYINGPIVDGIKLDSYKFNYSEYVTI